MVKRTRCRNGHHTRIDPNKIVFVDCRRCEDAYVYAHGQTIHSCDENIIGLFIPAEPLNPADLRNCWECERNIKVGDKVYLFRKDDESYRTYVEEVLCERCRKKYGVKENL